MQKAVMNETTRHCRGRRKSRKWKMMKDVLEARTKNFIEK